MSEFRRRLMMQKAQSDIPVGCVRCLYLESVRKTLGPYIDTERRMRNTDVFQATIYAQAGVNSDLSWFGWRLSDFNSPNQCLSSADNNRWYLLYGYGAGKQVDIPISGMMTLYVNPNEKIVMWNDYKETGSRDWEAPYPNGDSSINVYLFAANNAGTPYSGSVIRLYDYWVKDANGNMVQHLVPILDEQGTPCLYDVVGKKYHYNKRSEGSFNYEIL